MSLLTPSTGSILARQFPLKEKLSIVYLSRTNNTKALAEMIQKEVGGTLVSLELEKPYPENYKSIVDQVAKENEEGYMPALKTKVDVIKDYDTIFIGFPTWGMKLPPPIKSFLGTYNLNGITIVPFNTNAGYGIGNSIETVKKLAPKSKVLDAFETNGGVERDGILFVMEGEKELHVKSEVKRWLQQIIMIK
ncbi:MAG: flavodoxin [Chryseolinea sp.]